MLLIHSYPLINLEKQLLWGPLPVLFWEDANVWRLEDKLILLVSCWLHKPHDQVPQSTLSLPASSLPLQFLFLFRCRMGVTPSWESWKHQHHLSVQPVQWLSRVRLFVTPWTATCQASLSITNSWSLLKLMSIELVIPSNYLILCCPLLFLPSIFLSITVFSNESVPCIRWPRYWRFSFSISPSNEYSGLISFRMDWLVLLAVQRTLECLLQNHSSKTLVLQCSAFFIVQLSHPYMTTGKTIVLTRWTFVGIVMSLLFNMLSRLVITFLPRSKHLLISWLKSPSAVILELPPKIKPVTISTVSPSICREVMGPSLRRHDLSFLNVEF